MYVTPRTLLGIIRISQAMAKLNFRTEVVMNDVDESLKLMDYSFRSLKRLTGEDKSKRNARNEERRTDTQAEVMRHVRDICQANSNEPISVNEIFKRLGKRAAQVTIDKEELKNIINYYSRLQVLYMNQDEEVMFIWASFPQIEALTL